MGILAEVSAKVGWLLLSARAVGVSKLENRCLFHCRHQNRSLDRITLAQCGHSPALKVGIGG